MEKAVIQSRKKLDDAQDATRAAEEDIERFKQAYLQQKRQQHQEIQDAAYQKSVADQQEEVKEHDQKIDRLRRRMKRQRESTKSAREELLRKKEGMRTQLDRLTDQQRSIQAELEQAERELAQKLEEAKSRKKLSGIAPQKGNISELQTQMNLIRQKTAAAKEKMKAVDAALETLEEKSGKQERLMQKAEEKLTEQKTRFWPTMTGTNPLSRNRAMKICWRRPNTGSCPEMYGKLWNRPVKKKNRHPGPMTKPARPCGKPPGKK